MRKGLIWFSIVVAVIVIFFVMFFYYSRTCDNQTCFQDYLKDCKRAKYTSDGRMNFQYSILGKSSGNCEVEVKLLQGDLTNQESIKLEKKSMVCSLPLGVVASPEADLTLCTGSLKEGLQEIILNKLYAYIVQNFGKINADLLKVS